MKKNVTVRTQTQRPASEVFNWYLRPCAFIRLIPIRKKIHIISIEGSPDQIGSKVSVLVRIGFIWKKWVVVHETFIPGKEFSDRQIEGPFLSWNQVHRVLDKDGKGELEDEISFSFPLASLNNWIAGRFRRLLRWRQEIIANDLNTYAQYPDVKYKILLSGSSGLIGHQMLCFLRAGGHEVIRLFRTQENLPSDAIFWDPKTGNFPKDPFEGFDAVIHLAGESIASSRWTKAKKDKVFLSHCRDTWLLSQVLNRLNRPPKTMICASAVGYFGNRAEEKLTEESSRGKGFVADVCDKWEEATEAIKSRGARVVHTRFGYVLSMDGGMLPPILKAFRWGLGGKLGNGHQIMPWIAIDDVVGAIYHCLMKDDVMGVVNVVAPQPAAQAEFAKALAKHVHRPAFFHLPAWLLRLALGEMADELLLTSANVVPKRLIDTGYKFRYPALDEALTHLIL